MHLGDFIANAIRPGDGYLVDMYAFGVSAFQLVTGTLPYQKEAVMALLAEHSSAPVPDLTLLRPEMPRRFAALVSKLMAKDSDDRPQSMEHVAWELQQIRRERASSRARG